MSEVWNTYHFGSLRALKAAIRAYESLKSATLSGDVSSATILFDLDKVLGFDKNVRVKVLSDRQRRAIHLLLIKDYPAHQVASMMGVEPRVVYLTTNRGLNRILRFLHDGTLPKTGNHVLWQNWEKKYLRANSHAPRRELAEKLGRTPNAICLMLSEMRASGEIIRPGGQGKPNTRPPRQV